MGKRAKRGKSADAAGTFDDNVRAALADALTPHAGRVPSARPSALLDTRVIYCGDCLEQLRKLPDACVDRHASTQAYIDYMRPRCTAQV